MKLGYTIVYVQDVAKTVEFYERAFGCTRRFVHESGEYGELETGTTTLAFAADGMAEKNGVEVVFNRPNERAAGIELAFVTDDVDAAYDRALKAGAVSIKPTTKMPWGQTLAYVRDLNGVLLELCTPM